MAPRSNSRPSRRGRNSTVDSRTRPEISSFSARRIKGEIWTQPPSSRFFPAQPIGIARMAAEAGGGRRRAPDRISGDEGEEFAEPDDVEAAEAGWLTASIRIEGASLDASTATRGIRMSFWRRRRCGGRKRWRWRGGDCVWPGPCSSNPGWLRARETADLRDPEAFERRIFIKQNAAWLLEQELKKIDPAEEIAIGTATDPYQPIERRARVTRSILEVFARRSRAPDRDRDQVEADRAGYRSAAGDRAGGMRWWCT